MKKIFIIFLCLCIISNFVYAQELKPVKLLPAQLEKGKLLMQALKLRSSQREYSAKDLSLQVFSDLLWAANGVNRVDGKHTAPTALNMQEIDIYVARHDGLYVYDAKDNVLNPVLSEDIRAFTGKQSFAAQAPVNLIFVANYNKMGKTLEKERDFYAAVDTGFISQNVYLFCASEGLATVVRGWFDRAELEKAMKINSQQKVILVQTVGYPKE